MTAVTAQPAPAGPSAQPTVRRLIVYTLLFLLVVVAAIGLSGLLGRVLDVREVLARSDTSGMARSLAFTLVGGPFAALLWRVVWRRLDEDAERSSLAWGLYLAGVSAVSLLTFATALITTATSLIDGRWLPQQLSTGLVWLGVWLWHRWMSRHATKSPSRLTTLPTVIGQVYGLVIGVGGAVTALAVLLDEAITGVAGAVTLGDPWWMPALTSLAWAIGGAAIWWWHWVRDDGRRLSTGLADVALIVVGILGASVLTLGGVGTIVFVALRLGFDRTDPIAQLVDPLDAAIAAASIGALVWSYHRGIARARSDAVQYAARLVTAGVSMAATATGIGVIVNATLAALAPTLVESDPRTLLFGGISSFVVGAPLWWIVWRPTADELARAGSTGRRVYLIAVFGLSAIVALITLLVIGFRLFEFLLGDVSGGSLVDRVRAPTGLLVATLLVAGYHFGVWRRDRATLAAIAPARERTIGRVLLVTGGDADAQSRAIDEATGAAVTVWMRAEPESADSDAADPGPGAEQLARALNGVTGTTVLVLAGPGERVEVVPLLGGTRLRGR